MALYMVHKRNPYFKNGTIIELFEDGFQECVMCERRTGMQYAKTHKGLILPEEDIMPFCIKMLDRGFDDPKLRRRSGKQHTAPDGVTPDELQEFL